LKESGKTRAADASALFNQAITTDPRNARAYWELGWSQQIAGDFDSAITTWGTLKTLAPKYPDLETFTAIAMARRGEKAPEPPAPPKKTKAHHRTDMKTDLAR
jgi:cytochrome c-type biogenesis protein CcmH/NrfG